jgi:hypothetical protein
MDSLLIDGEDNPRVGHRVELGRILDLCLMFIIMSCRGLHKAKLQSPKKRLDIKIDGCLKQEDKCWPNTSWLELSKEGKERLIFRRGAEILVILRSKMKPKEKEQIYRDCYPWNIRAVIVEVDDGFMSDTISLDYRDQSIRGRGFPTSAPTHGTRARSSPSGRNLG